MANEQNLVPLSTRKAREIGRKGGIASGIAKRQKKTLAQIGDMIGSLAIKSEDTKQILREAGISDEDMIEDVAILFELKEKAKKGDIRAIELLTKLRGQLRVDEPLANVQIQSVKISFGDRIIDGEEN